MNHPTAWTPPADVANKLQSYWERWQISAARLGGTPHCFSLDLPLRKPDVRRISECFDRMGIGSQDKITSSRSGPR